MIAERHNLLATVLFVFISQTLAMLPMDVVILIFLMTRANNDADFFALLEKT